MQSKMYIKRDKLIDLIDYDFICRSHHNYLEDKHINCDYTKYITDDLLFLVDDSNCELVLFSNKLMSYIPINTYDNRLNDFKHLIEYR